MVTVKRRVFASALTGCITALALISCGGGGGNATPAASVAPPPPPPPPPTGGSSAPTFTPGVFEDDSLFQAMCESPRSGINPATNAPFPDQQGSTLLENFWLRSWSNDTYLFYDEIVDQDPNDFTDRLAYFDTLRTTETTPSGTPRDQFHFTIPSDEYQDIISGVSAGYGFEIALLSTTPPRDARIAFVDPGSPASAPGIDLMRGAEILEVDGVSVADGDAAALNAGLFPNALNETHTFLVRDAGSSATRSVSLTSAQITTVPVNTTSVINTSTGNVGYIHFTTFGTEVAEQALFTAFSNMATQNVTDLVLDLRYNGGGFLAIASQLSYMIAGDARTNGRTFELLTFNDKHPTTDPVTGRPISPTPFFDEGLGFSVNEGQNLPDLNLNRVFVLSTDRTCSASESVINALRGINVEVVLIGTRTCGKPYGFYPTDNCGETYFTIQFAGLNDQGFGDYADGFSPQNTTDSIVGVTIPGCEVADDFNNQLGDETEAMLAAALQFRADGTCPATTTTKPQNSRVAKSTRISDTSADLLEDPRIARRRFVQQNSLRRNQ